MMKFFGEVKKHNRNGTKFGFPTANLFIKNFNDSGIFVGYTRLLKTKNEKIKIAFNDTALPSIIFVGAAETLGQEDFRLESYILDFPKIDLYEAEIEVTIVDKIRENEKFDSIDKLISQMKQDELTAKKWFNEDTDV